MKRIIMFFSFLLLGTFVLFAQEPDVPSNWQDLYDNYLLYFGGYLGMAGIVTFLAEYVIRLLKLSTKFLKILFVALISVGLSFLASAVNIGFLGGAEWWVVLLQSGLITAAAAGLRGANLLFVKTIVDFVIGLIASKEPKVE
jgi:hypothetical protein